MRWARFAAAVVLIGCPAALFADERLPLGLFAMEVGNAPKLVVTRVNPASVADRAGVRRDDVLLRLNDTPVRTQQALREAFANAPGGEFTITVDRPGKGQVTLRGRK